MANSDAEPSALAGRHGTKVGMAAWIGKTAPVWFLFEANRAGKFPRVVVYE
jgi:hypothetical protein